nr:MAG TPA: hypothetical protein [Bacteriophage sp.]
MHRKSKILLQIFPVLLISQFVFIVLTSQVIVQNLLII